ncbi:MAG: mechanosensitive ion channel family protein [Christensenellales bacterium]
MMKEIQTFIESILWVPILVGILKIIAIFIGTRILLLVIRLLLKAVVKRAQAKEGDEAKVKKTKTMVSIVRSIVKYVVNFIALLMILDVMGLSVAASSLLATAGVGGLAIGIGAQSLIKDVINGFFLMTEGQYNVGDYITAGGVTGFVEGITLRATRLKGFRGENNVVPNGSISTVTNYSRGTYSAVVACEIAYESDLDRAISAMERAGKLYKERNPQNVLADPVVLGVTALNKTGIELKMALDVKPMTHFQAEREILRLVIECFAEDGIEMPNIRTVIVGNEHDI